MRDESVDDTTATPRSRGSSTVVDRCLSAVQMRQALNKLDEDGEAGRNAMNSLKQCVEVMDPATVPRFLSQVSETKEKGNSNSRGFAISLYEEVARVHGKLIIPHIPRVMTTLKRGLSASGSSPQLPQACAKVVLAIAKYAIDDRLPPASGQRQRDGGLAEIDRGKDGNSDDVLKHLCDPLLGVLVGKLEPLAAGAALCLQVLVESEQWQYAADDLVQHLFQKVATALAEKSMRTVAHLQLARALSISNPSFLSLNQGTTAELLLKAGAQVLKSSTATTSWQQRESAAQLVTVILCNVDRHVVAEEELHSAVHALESCKLDRTSNVRTSVKEGLQAARSLLEEETFVSIDKDREKKQSLPPREKVLERLGSISLSLSLLPARRPTRDDSSISSLESMSPVRLRPAASDAGAAAPHHQQSRPPTPSVIPLSPSAPSSSPPRARGGASRKHHHHRGVSSSSALRSPLRVATQRLHTRSAKSLDTFQNFEFLRKENLPSSNDDDDGGNLNGKGVGARDINMDFDAPSSNTRSSIAGSRRDWSNKGMWKPDHSALEAPATADHFSDMETSPGVVSGRRNECRSHSPVQGAIYGNQGQQELGDLSGDEDMCLFESNPTLHEGGSRNDEEDQLIDVKLMRGRRKDSPSSRATLSSRSLHGVLDSSSMKHVFELKGPAVVGSAMRSPVRSIDVDKNWASKLSPSKSIDEWKESSNELLKSPLKDDSPAHLRSFRGGHSPSPKPLIDPTEFTAFTTPRRLVRSLQQKFSSPQPETASGMAKTCQDDDLGAAEMVTTDMDVETPTSSSTGWSVRTNPIASDESLRTDSEDSDHDKGRTVWKKMVLGSLTSPPFPAPCTPVQETDNPDPNDSFRHRVNQPPSPASLDAATPKPFLLPREEPLVPKILFKEDHSPSAYISTATPDREEKMAPSKSDFFQDNMMQEAEELSYSASNSVEEALAALLHEPACGDASDGVNSQGSGIESSITEAAVPRAPMIEPSNESAYQDSEGSVVLLEDDSVSTAATEDLSKSMDDDNDKQLVGLTWREYVRTRWNAQRSQSLLKWHVCMVVVGVPLAIALSKVVFPSDSAHYLVPT